MEAFKKELDALLQKYPDLPEFTFTVRPRIVIEEKKQYSPVTVPHIPISSIQPLAYIPTSSTTMGSGTAKGIELPNLESRVSAERINEIKKMVTTE